MGSKDHTGWIEDVVSEVRKYVKARKYRITNHAQERQEQYTITLPELVYVLTHGFHEKDKTLFDNAFQCWKYAIRGKTIDSSIDMRVIVAFKDEMAVLTVIRLDKKGRKK
jgi:hypothetical protein